MINQKQNGSKSFNFIDYLLSSSTSPPLITLRIFVDTAITLILSITFISTLPTLANGQVDSVSAVSDLLIIEIDELQVTATHLTTPFSSSGRNVSVIGEEEIRRTSATSLDELLRTFTGLNINARQQFGIQADIGMRGSTYSQVMVLLDNIPLSDPLTGHFNANIPVPLSEIGRVELIRGPAAASYGANAVGGVIHIKTQSYLRRHLTGKRNPENSSAIVSVNASDNTSGNAPDNASNNALGNTSNNTSDNATVMVANPPDGAKQVRSRRTNQASVQVRQSVGAHALSISDGAITLQTGPWDFSAGARIARSDGEVFDNPAYTAGLSQQETFRTFFDHSNATVSARYSRSSAPNERFTMYTRGGIEQRDFNARYFYTNSLYDQSVESIRNQWALTSLEYKSGRNNLRLDGGFRSVTDEFNFNAAIAPVNEHTTHQTYLNLSHEFTRGANVHTLNNTHARAQSHARNSVRTRSSTTHSRSTDFRLMTGIQLLNQLIESTDRGDHRDTSLGLYIIGSMSDTRNDRWRLTGSLRLQNDPNGETTLLPQLSGSRQLKAGWTVRASAGRAVRNGDFTERYIANNLPTILPGRNIGNPLLEPESSVTLDAGFDWSPAPEQITPSLTSLRLSSTLFYRISDRLIDYVSTPAEEIPTAQPDQLTPGATYFYTRNIADSQTLGLEIEGAASHWLMTNHRLSYRFGYTWLSTTNGDGVVSRYIANHPEHQLSFTLDLNIDAHWSLRSEAYLQIRDTNLNADQSESLNSKIPSSYLVSNLKATVRPWRGWYGGGTIQFFAKIYNLTDTKYQEILGAPMPGRWISAGVELHF